MSDVEAVYKSVFEVGEPVVLTIYYDNGRATNILYVLGPCVDEHHFVIPQGSRGERCKIGKFMTGLSAFGALGIDLGDNENRVFDVSEVLQLVAQHVPPNLSSASCEIVRWLLSVMAYTWEKIAEVCAGYPMPPDNFGPRAYPALHDTSQLGTPYAKYTQLFLAKILGIGKQAERNAKALKNQLEESDKFHVHVDDYIERIQKRLQKFRNWKDCQYPVSLPSAAAGPPKGLMGHNYQQQAVSIAKSRALNPSETAPTVDVNNDALPQNGICIRMMQPFAAGPPVHHAPHVNPQPAEANFGGTELPDSVHVEPCVPRRTVRAGLQAPQPLPADYTAGPPEAVHQEGPAVPVKLLVPKVYPGVFVTKNRTGALVLPPTAPPPTPTQTKSREETPALPTHLVATPVVTHAEDEPVANAEGVVTRPRASIRPIR